MIAIFDVDYRENGTAVLGGVVLHQLTDYQPKYEFALPIAQVAEYEPGSFYKRELPCLLQGLQHIESQLGNSQIKTVVVDGYVWLDDQNKPGLGAKLHEALGGQVVVIGIAKTAFKQTDHTEEVLRGDSARPLFVTAAGMETAKAAEIVRRMAGKSRLPNMVKRADRLCRDG